MSTPRLKDQSRVASNGCEPRVFWFDLENLYCVTFFQAIIKRLSELGHHVYITYRDFPGLEELLHLYGLSGTRIGMYGAKSMLRKTQKTVKRALLLANYSRRKEIDLAVCFSRSLALSCALSRIPNATVLDYEHVSVGIYRWFSDWIFVPTDVPDEVWLEKKVPTKKLVKFRGLKEEVYMTGCDMNGTILKRLGLDQRKVIAIIRPPATEAHYHEGMSNEICHCILSRVAADPSISAILVPRGRDESFDDFLRFENIVKLRFPVLAAELITASDLVISGGGTMAREAAALGIPSYSIFTGRQGAVDVRLSREDRLHLIRKPKDIERIQFRKRKRKIPGQTRNLPLAEFFVAKFITLADGRS